MDKFSQHSLEEELLGLLANQVRYSPVPVVLSMGLVAFMASGYVPTSMWVTWMAAVVAMQLVRSVTFLRLAKHSQFSPTSRLRTAILINIGNTVLHSLSLFWFPQFTLFEAAAQSMLFIGMGVASIATTVGFRPFTLAHVVGGLLPLFCLWIWSGIAGPGGTIALALGIIGLGYGATLITVASRIFRMYRETFDNRQQLQEALAKAEAADKAKTRFLASASHDLRQPIHALSLFTAALGMRALDDRSRAVVEKMEQAVQALSYQMDALLDISKLDAGIVSVRSESFVLQPLLDRLVGELRDEAMARDVSLSLDCPVEAWVNSDARLLERIVRNLLVNAITHNQQCSVSLRAEPRDGDWLLTLRDTGAGIPDKEQGRIFEEFYQLENPERDRSKGLGLGLAIVQRLAQLLGIDMQFESRLGQGTQFIFSLPGSVETPVAAVPARRDTALDSLSVLVVDDEAAVREGMQMLLESLGCTVSTADGTDTAVTLVAGARPDLALVDFRLRGNDSGLQTIHRLRQLYPGLPAIIVSGDTAPDRLREARAAGVPVLNKPVLVEPLKDAIAESCHLED